MSQFDPNEMTMSIIEVDEALKDDAFLSYDSDTLPEDIRSILNKWKQSEKVNLGNSSSVYENNAKFIDTRTFTRPKKKSLDGTFSNMSNDVLLEQEHTVTPINLKIGGLVTSVQDNFLSATTPPVLMDSSLITSNDFSNLDFLSNEFENIRHQVDNLKYDKNTHFNGYNLDDVINDRNFLEKLCTTDVGMQKDDHISRTDFILNDETYSSGNNTLQNSEDFSMKSSENVPVVILNETFEPRIDTQQPMNPKEQDSLDILNGTFGITNSSNTNSVNNTYVQDLKVIEIKTPKNLTFDKLDCDGLVPYEIGCTPESDFKTKLLNRRSLENLSPITKMMVPVTENEIVLEHTHSTPVHTPSKAKIACDEVNRTFTPNSPINLRRKAVVNNMNNTIVLDNNELNEFDFNKIPQNLISQAEEERRSLVNFVEFEKSIQLLEAGDKSEKEFDELLNSIGNIDNKIINEKMRNSVDNIKKRHSLLHASGNHQSENNLTVDNLKLSDSMSKSMNSSTGSERLLNRRSRMYDDNAGQTQQNLTNTLEVNNVPNATELNDNVNKNQLPEKKERDRDRFKTIRITRKPNDDVLNLPDADAAVESGEPQTNESNLHAQTNTPLPLDNDNGKINPIVNTNTFKKPHSLLPTKPSGLCRLRYAQKNNSMLAQPLKSNSEDNLLGKNRVNDENGCTGPVDNKSITKHLEFPMGEKAKSFHNITGCDSLGPNSNLKSKLSISKPVSKLTYPRPSGLARPMESKYSASNLRLPRPSLANSASKINIENLANKVDTKVNVSLRSNLSGLRKPISTARPSSAYNSYHNNTNNKKSDLDRDVSSARACSSNSLSSSASSRESSQHCNERTASIENVDNETILIISNQQQNEILKPSNQSGIRPPSNLRPPTARSGLPRPTGNPRR